MKILQITILLLLTAAPFCAQVGVNTTNPQALMDISVKRANADGTGSITDTTQTLGLLAPRVTKAELTANTASYGTNQTGALIQSDGTVWWRIGL